MSTPNEEGTVLKKYYEPTPVKFRKIGDIILITCTAIQPLTMTLPLTDAQRVWVNFGIGVAGVIGKIITNFFSTE